jgi:hypothetical protein
VTTKTAERSQKGAAMTDQIRHPGRWFGLLVLVATGMVCGACGSTGTGGSSGTGDIGVQTSQMFITVENRAGLPLTDIKIEVVPYGGQASFTTSVYRLEGGEKRDLSLGQFGSRDGTPLNLRVVKPRIVRVTATDVSGKPHQVEVPWR